MSFPTSLTTLAHLMAGEFDNREQAIADPVWFVHLRLWQHPVYLFEDSLTLFAEQANVLKSDQPYRQRLLRLQAVDDSPTGIQVQYYAFKDPSLVKGAGANPQQLQDLTLDAIEHLPGCILQVTQGKSAAQDTFVASPPANTCCNFTYQGETRQVVLGFEARPHQFVSYDKGVDPQTGQALWGAIMGPYQFTKRQEFHFSL